MRSMQTYKTLILGCLFFLLLGVILEKQPWLDPAREAARTHVIPTSMLNFGSMGVVLKEMGALKSVSNDGVLYPLSREIQPDPSANVFRKKRHVGRLLFEANPGGGHSLPSSTVLADADKKGTVPVLSVVIDSNRLYSADSGIVANPEKRGKEWERLAYVSYFEGRRLLFASGAGMRLHGGKLSHRASGSNFRLYFRKTYGIAQFLSGVVGEGADPVKTLVVRGNGPYTMRHASPLAFDLVRKIGGFAPQGKMVRFFLNGKEKGFYWMGEHLSTRQWKAHPGHEDLDFYRYRSTSDTNSVAAYRKLHEWVEGMAAPILLSNIETRIDVDNFCAHMFSLAFCGTGDWVQGVAMRDRVLPTGKWCWINWDMDQSWKRFGTEKKEGGPRWEKRSFGIFEYGEGWTDRAAGPQPIDASTDLRSLLFFRLWRESPEFCQKMTRKGMDWLNHQLTAEYLQHRLNVYSEFHYSQLNRDSWNHQMRSFMKYRPQFMRKELQLFFGAGKCHEVRVDAGSGMTCWVDGHREAGPYAGQYFAGQTVTVRAEDAEGMAGLRWRVGGGVVSSDLLTLTIQEDLLIEALPFERVP